MRFRTNLIVDKVPKLLKTMQVIEKLDRTCILHLPPPDSDVLRIIVYPDSIGAMASFAVMKRREWFETYRIESQNSNQIGLEMEVQNLLKALRSGAAADEIMLRLTKKGGPALTFEIDTPLGPILQDVPVNILSAIRLQECIEPESEPEKGFMLPEFPVLHNILERFKGLSNDLVIECDVKQDTADLSLEVHTDMVSVRSAFDDQRCASYGGAGATQEGASDTGKIKAVVDRRNFARCVYADALAPEHTICFLFGSNVVVHVVGTWGVDMSYYIPKRHAL